MELICPHGHHSTEADYCSVCGAPMHPSKPVEQSQLSPINGPVMECPVCGVERDNEHARFCENCRYDYKEKKPYEGGAIVTPSNSNSSLSGGLDTAIVPPLAPEPVVDANQFNTASLLRWDIIVSVVTTAKGPEGQTPNDLTPKIYSLDLDDVLIGRRSDKEGIHPDIEIREDLGVSRRHARILRKPDGTLFLLDQSSNGTRLNGVDIPSRVETPFNEGDEIGIGFWTQLKLRAR